MADNYNVKSYGAVGDGNADDTAAIQSALGAASGGGVVFFPMGAYKITSVLNLPAGVTILGAGVEGTRILPSTQGQVVFQRLQSALGAANLSIQQLEIDCRSTSGVIAVNLTLTMFVSIAQVIFTGCQQNLNADRCNEVVLANCMARGTSSLKAGVINVFSSDPNDYAFSVKIDKYLVRNVGTGLAGDAITFTRVVGAVVSNLDINDGHIGGTVNGVVFRGDCQGCKFVDSIIGASGFGCVIGRDLMHTSSTVYPSFITVANVDLDQPQTACVYVEHGFYINILGGQFTSSGVNTSGAGILVQTGDSGNPNGLISIIGSRVNGFSGQNGNGILFGSNVSNATIEACQVDSCATGIGVVGGNSTHMSIMGNNVVNNATPINFGGSTSGNVIRNNVGVANIQ